ncbi:MAG TPA: EamA family transporter [Anaerolineaceae bacterium]|nr:EamA family transporter [Anaerolineaceae bacterium]
MSSGSPSQKKQPSLAAIWAGMFAIYVFWGSTYLAIHYAVETIPPFFMAGARFLIAGSILFVYRLLAGDPLPIRQEWRSAWIIGWFLLMGGNGGVVWAEQFVPSSIAALIIGTVPLWMVLIDALRPGGNQPDVKAFLGVGIGFLGIVVLFWPFNGNSGSTGQEANLLGSIVLLLAAISWATGSLISRKARLPESPLMGSAMEMLIGGSGLVLLGLAVGEANQLNLSRISWQSEAGITYLIFFGSLAGFTAYTWLLRVAPTSLVSTYAYVNPLVAVVLGYFIASEPITIRTLLAATVILGSVVLISRINSQSQPAWLRHEPDPGAAAED